jgi:UDP:flavonoid glycosyltransferase YjiC (YdhE family)
MINNSKKRILVATLNWGLGHATRCIPIIKALQDEGYEPIIASDGQALQLLIKEFPNLKRVNLPGYRIKYSQKGWMFKWKLFFQIPKIIRAIYKEHKAVVNYVGQNKIEGIISDNRLGCFSKDIPSVFITHQLQVLSGTSSKITSYLHDWFIKKYNVCWVPDLAGPMNLSGKLGHPKKRLLPVHYLGVISRFSQLDLPIVYDLFVILSGPEPQRTLLEKLLTLELEKFDGNILFVRGVVSEIQTCEKIKNITFYNFMNSTQLETAFNQSKIILARSGYTTILDLAKLEKKAFFIPTPGQYEQEYLAKKLKQEGVAPSIKQEKFKIQMLAEIDFYKGFVGFNKTTDLKPLFKIFN